jgi:hypothetical protein
VLKHLLVNGASRLVGAREIAGAHQEFSYDLAAGETEGRFEQFDPFFFGQRVMVVEPFFERTEFFLNFLYLFSVVDGGVDLEAVADDAGIGQEAIALTLAITGNLVDIEVIEGAEEIFFLFQDSRPGQAGLVDLQDEAGEQAVVIFDGKAIFVVVVVYVHIVLFHVLYEGAVAGEFFHGGL